MAKTFTPRQKNWKWFADDGAEPSTQLADEITKPTLPDNEAIIRLRVSIQEQGDAAGPNAAWSLQYSTNEVDWVNFGAANHWNYANGQATEGNSVTSFKLTDPPTEYGLYYESGVLTHILAKSDFEESDFAIIATSNLSETTTYYFRVLINATEVPLDSGETHPQVLTGLNSVKPNVNTPAVVTDNVNVAVALNINVYDTAKVADVPVIEKASEFTLALSDYISASGENTTYQLTPPAGKATTDFTAGRIQDDENPTDNINIPTDDYTEIEFCIKGTALAVESQQYDFRLTVDGTPFDTYNQTPQLTISVGTGDRSINIYDSAYGSENINPAMADLGINVAECIDSEDLMGR